MQLGMMDCRNFWIFIASHFPCFSSELSQGLQASQKHSWKPKPLSPALIIAATDKFLRLRPVFSLASILIMCDSQFRAPEQAILIQTDSSKFATMREITILTCRFIEEISRLRGKCWDTLPQGDHSVLQGKLLASSLVVMAESMRPRATIVETTSNVWRSFLPLTDS